MTVRHKLIYSRYHSFRTPTSISITVLVRCPRVHGTEFGAHECPAVRITTYTEGRERQSEQMEAADLREWRNRGR